MKEFESVTVVKYLTITMDKTGSALKPLSENRVFKYKPILEALLNRFPDDSTEHFCFFLTHEICTK